MKPLCRFIEALKIIYVEATEEEVYTKYPLTSPRKMTNQSDSETSKHKSIQSPHFDKSFGPEYQAAITPEEQSADIQEAFAND